MSSGQGRSGRGRGGGGGSRGGRGDSQSRGGFRGSGSRGGSRGRGGPPEPGETGELPILGQAAVQAEPQASGGIYGTPGPTPDAAVTTLENTLVALTRDQTFDGFPGRRSYGTRGRQTVMRTNYLKIITPDDPDAKGITKKALYRYSVDVATDITKPKRRRLLKAITSHSKFQGKIVATDYSSIIVTTEPLDLGESDEWQETITLAPLDGNTPTSQGDTVPDFVQQAQLRNQFTFTVAAQGSFTLDGIMAYLKRPTTGVPYPNSKDIVQLLNIVLCKPAQTHPTVANVGANKFYPFGPHPGVERKWLGGGLEALRGYYISVRQGTIGLMANLNVTCGAFYIEDIIPNLLGKGQAEMLPSVESEAFIKGLKVLVLYREKDGTSKHKTKTIFGFANRGTKRFGSGDEVTFEHTDPTSGRKQQISVNDYWTKYNGAELQWPNLAVLNVGTLDSPQYVPQELCMLLAGQPYRRILSGNQTSDMLKFAARSPNLNANSTVGSPDQPGNGLRLFYLKDTQNQANSVNQFGFSVDTKMIVVPARILNSPTVKYKNRTLDTIREGSWNCAKTQFSVPGKIDKWQVLVINLENKNALIDRPKYADTLAPEDLFSKMQKDFKEYGINMGTRVQTNTIMLRALTRGNRNENNGILQQAFAAAQKNGVRLLFIVLPEQDKWLYARIKFYGDIKFGIHSINAIGTKLQKGKGQDMFIGNLALKFNIKGGGVAHQVPNTLSAPLDNNTMLVGIDVTHPSPGSSDTAPSIAAVVASVDANLFQWPGSVRTQTGREEMVQALSDMMVERLDLWQARHRQYPSKIVVYRDGVSEGQFSKVLELEVPPIQEAFKKRYGARNKWPRMTIIIVGKRHHTRFYPTEEKDADWNAQRQRGSWNPLPGTIVDRGIADRNLREFWLQAHQGLQGTARPAHYTVIMDEIRFEADQMEQITHNLCYLFNRAPKAVSICPPAYYADLLCERGRCYLYSVLAENTPGEGGRFDRNTAEWTQGVHPNLRESTWYI